MILSHQPSHQCQTASARRRWQGFSMSEIVVTISVLGILATIVIMELSGNYESARATLARNRVEQLNNALTTWATARTEMIFSRLDDSTADEMKVLRDLQYRHPDEDKADINSPYMPPEYNPKTSSSLNDYRIRWNGRRYELLMPGTNGSGLKMVFDASDITEAFTFPPNYTSGGR
jgi:prepilin-type N-terminal cleavage/methylation domain-containing protein